MESIIKELWHGNIIPQEDSRTNSKEMKELLGYYGTAYAFRRNIAKWADVINLSTKRNSYNNQSRERQYPILRLGESQRGVRILSWRGVCCSGQCLCQPFHYGINLSLYLLVTQIPRRVSSSRYAPCLRYANSPFRFANESSSPLTVAKNKGHPQGVSLFFGAGRGIRTPVPFGQTVFKTASLWPLRYSCLS